jgi:hypothetical protein
MKNQPVLQPNKALQLTANPLRGLSAAELGRYSERLLSGNLHANLHSSL